MNKLINLIKRIFKMEQPDQTAQGEVAQTTTADQVVHTDHYGWLHNLYGAAKKIETEFAVSSRAAIQAALLVAGKIEDNGTHYDLVAFVDKVDDLIKADGVEMLDKAIDYAKSFAAKQTSTGTDQGDQSSAPQPEQIAETQPAQPEVSQDPQSPVEQQAQ